MKKARNYLLLLLLAAFAVHTLWLAIAPLVPYIIAALVVVLIVGFLYYRSTRW
ncbi:hypothetical protein [Streptomyces sp. NPDC048669]|uniref:hypothetical protein n=1 Tax=Streptomyces sp. NPDC048669 TaxID=3155267 RepID=UPI003423D21E